MTTKRIFASLHDFEDVVGEHLGVSPWYTIDQEQIDQFAAATGDYEWIHVDPVRAASGPFGATIAHGQLTFSLAAVLFQEIYQIEGLGGGVYYGADRLRFPHAVRVGSRIRASVTLVDVKRLPVGSRITLGCVIEIEGVKKPACTADVIVFLSAATADTPVASPS